MLTPISIHAPSRERQDFPLICDKFGHISIHAPSRERPAAEIQAEGGREFQSTLPRGSDLTFSTANSSASYFNPRSLAGATGGLLLSSIFIRFQSTLPRGSDKNMMPLTPIVGISIHAPSRERQHQNKLLLYSFKSSIFCELAQLKYSKIYFDVRKLIVSHSSLSCEPKLNFMFHITSHRIILHYFYSCQSICK